MFILSLVGLGAFFVALAYGASVDRRGEPMPKWFVVVIGIVAALLYYRSDLSLTNLWAALSSWGFWLPVLSFFGIGILYSLLEFSLYVRRAARDLAVKWKMFLEKTDVVPVLDDNGNPVLVPLIRRSIRGEEEFVLDRKGERELVRKTRARTNAELYEEARKTSVDPAVLKEAIEHTSSFLILNRDSNSIISLQADSTKLGIVPTVNRLNLAANLAVWISLWPAYAVSLVAGDLLTEIFRLLADAVTAVSSRFVKLVFAHVFEV